MTIFARYIYYAYLPVDIMHISINYLGLDRGMRKLIFYKVYCLKGFIMASLPHLRLVYFKMRALAETAQMMLHYGNVPYSYEMAWNYFGKPWPEVKPTVAYKQLPLLVVDNETIITQSGAIVRFLAPLTGTMPEDTLLAAKVDAAFEATQAMFIPLNPTINFAVGDGFIKKRDGLMKGLLSQLDDFERLLNNSSDGDFMFGTTPFYCDFGAYHHISLALMLDENLLADFPAIVTMMQAVEGLNGVKAYLDSRPELIGVGTKPQMVINGVAVPTGVMAD